MCVVSLSFFWACALTHTTTLQVSAKGEILDLKNTVNGMVLRLRTLAVEVTRVTLEVSAVWGYSGGVGWRGWLASREAVVPFRSQRREWRGAMGWSGARYETS
jgi:hypothetical protein